MKLSRNQHTIASSCQVTGRGYWSGQTVCVSMHPAPVNSGIRFIRVDLPGRPACPATSEFVTAINFRTNLCRGDASFAMIEHLMAALAGLEIDNCDIEMDGQEVPGMDGSSAAFVDRLRTAGLIIQAAAKPRLVIDTPFRVQNGDAWVDVTPATAGESHFGYDLCYGPASPIPAAKFGVDLTVHRFITGIATARTFVTRQQADALHAQGVALHVTAGDLIVFDQDGPVQTNLRFADEPSRHKTLDLIGDLALTGLDLIGRFASHRGGHVLNSMLAQQLMKLHAQQRQRVSTHSVASVRSGRHADRRRAA